jgi:integrase
MTPHHYTMAPETRALLRQFDDERRLAALLNAPARVLRRAVSAKRLNRSDLVEAQAALAVQVLLDAPVRVGNLAAIDLDRHVLRSGGGRARRVHLYFPAAEVKNDRELELPLTAETVELLDLYIEHIRPRVVRSPNSFLFPGEANGPKGVGLLSSQIRDFMHRHVGLRMSAHKFRHLIGYLFLKQHPGAHEVVRQLLGHKSIDTTIRYYASLEQDEAFELYDSFLDELRDAAHPPAKPRRKRP